VYATGAIAIGVPGCPEFAACTASIASARMALTESWSRSVEVAVMAVSVPGDLPHRASQCIEVKRSVPPTGYGVGQVVAFPLSAKVACALIAQSG
jgi:hypothetical protein